ncbi:SymE family type I addiction module toxin [Xanthomonas arboricola]|nr:SymE family type I addiction module toxin [Xanthomonas arboricola]
MRFLTSRHPVATLRLRGRWLEQMGFAIGKKLHVRVRDGELVVGLVTED